MLINATYFILRSLNHDAYLGYQYQHNTTGRGICILIQKGCGDIHQTIGGIVTFIKGNKR